MRTKHEVMPGALLAVLVATGSQAAAFNEINADAAIQRPFFTGIVPKTVLA